MLWATKSFNSTLNAEWMNSPHLKANQTGSSMGLVVSKVASWSSGLGSNPGLSNFCKRPKHFKLVDIESILINRIAQRRHKTIAAFRKGEICFNSHSIESSEHKSSLLHFDTKITVIEKVTSHTHTQHAYSIQHTAHTQHTHPCTHPLKTHTREGEATVKNKTKDLCFCLGWFDAGGETWIWLIDFLARCLSEIQSTLLKGN